MPASPAPRIRTDAPFGSPSSRSGPLYPDSDAKPSAVIASYIAALPATVPISASRSRRLTWAEKSGMAFSLVGSHGLLLHLSPCGRGRLASSDARRVRGYGL